MTKPTEKHAQENRKEDQKRSVMLHIDKSSLPIWINEPCKKLDDTILFFYQYDPITQY